MKKHCVSLELAEQLKIAGWKKETEFCWTKNSFGVWGLEYIEEGLNNGQGMPAPLATEILEELPVGIKVENYKSINGNKVMVKLALENETCWGNLPDALAKMWLYLR